MSSRWPVLAVIVATTAAVYLQVRDHEFVSYDDPAYVADNPLLDAGLGPAGVARAFTEPYFANWIPLTILSYQIDHALHGEAPRGYLLTNLALHLLATALLFLAFERMTGALWPSAAVAAVFGVHPLHVESVAWVSQRKDVLAAVFFMATLLAWTRYARAPGLARYLVAAACLAAGLLAKPVVVTLPFVLLLLDYWPLARLGAPEAPYRIESARLRRALVEKLPLLALVAGASAVTLAVQEGAGASHTADVPLSLRALNAVDSYGHYLRDSIWPAGLAAFYPHPMDRIAAPSVAGAGVAVAALSAAALAGARRFPFLFVGWAWFLGTLVPTLGIVQVGVAARADRYMYLPLIGLAVVVAYGAAELVRRRPALRVPAALTGAAAVAALALAAHAQVAHWRDSQALFSRALAVTESNPLAHRQLGVARLAAGDLAAAEDHFRAALAAQPGWGTARLDLGLVLLRRGRAADGVRELEAALAAGADAATTRAALGQAAEALGEPGRAIEYYRAALADGGDGVTVANNLAWLLATAEPASLRDPPEAIRLAELAVARGGASAGLLDTLAASYAAAGRVDDAVRVQERAVAAAPAPLQRELADRLERYRSLRRR